MPVKVFGKVNGLKELEKSLLDLGKTYGDPKYALQALRPALKKAAEPIEETIKFNTPVDEGTLRDSTQTRIMKTNKRAKNKLGEDAVIHAEIGWHWKGDKRLWRQSLAVEFGNSKTAAQPVLYPALQQNAGNALNIFKSELATSIKKKAQSLAKKFGKKK